MGYCGKAIEVKFYPPFPSKQGLESRNFNLRITMADSSKEINQFIDRARSGSTTAIKLLIESLNPSVLKAIRSRLNRKLRTKFDSQDFAQDVWASFFANNSEDIDFQTKEEITAYLIKMAKHKVIDAVRQRLKTKKYNLNKERPLETESSGAKAEPASSQPSPSQLLMTKEEWDQLMKDLPPLYRQVLVLSRLGYGSTKIAEKMGINRRKVSRIFEKLRLKMNGTGESENIPNQDPGS